jgi:hypothetical protein
VAELLLERGLGGPKVAPVFAGTDTATTLRQAMRGPGEAPPASPCRVRSEDADQEARATPGADREARPNTRKVE